VAVVRLRVVFCALKAPGSSVEDAPLSVQLEPTDASPMWSTGAVPGPSASVTGVRKLVPRPRRLYKRRRPSQLVPRPIGSTTGSSRAAMLSMIEREGAGETALHKATRLAYEVRLEFNALMNVRRSINLRSFPSLKFSCASAARVKFNLQS